MLEFLDKNKEWIFSGVGLTVVALTALFARKMFGLFRPQGPTVRVSGAVAGTPLTGMFRLLSINVENRTEKTLYLDNIFLEMDTREQFMPMRDPLTGQGQARRELMPGSSFSFHIPASDILESGVPLEDFRCAAVRDAIGRVYRSSGRQLQEMLRSICA
jgi:hypothetical protein